MHAAYNASCEKAKKRATSPLAAIARSSQRMLNPAAHSTACSASPSAAAEPAAIHAVVALGVTDGRLDGLAPLEPACAAARPVT